MGNVFTVDGFAIWVNIREKRHRGRPTGRLSAQVYSENSQIVTFGEGRDGFAREKIFEHMMDLLNQFTKKVKIPEGETSVEASDLGFKPGCWPEVLRSESQNFHFVEFRKNSEGEIEFAEYRAGPSILHVFND